MLLIKLAWYKTGDSFSIECPNEDFVSWFIEKCHIHGNNFNLSTVLHNQQSRFVDDEIVALKKCINSVNVFLSKIKWPLIDVPKELEDQKTLNHLHKQWVMIHRRNPQLDQLMFKIDPELFQNFHDINKLIHVIESSFNYHLRDDTLWTIDNPFPLNKDFSNYHLSICHTDFGKSSFEKWDTNDDYPNDPELSNWKTIGSSLLLDLHSGRRYDGLPKSYEQYCQEHGIDIVSQYWPIGNITDAGKNLGQIRKLCNRNFQIQDNPLQFVSM
jgi:hypothetical protein